MSRVSTTNDAKARIQDSVASPDLEPVGFSLELPQSMYGRLQALKAVTRLPCAYFVREALMAYLDSDYAKGLLERAKKRS